MARRRTSGAPNKSDVIREFIAHNRAAGPKEIRESLRQQGHDVSIALVNRIKYSDPIAKSGSSSTGSSSTGRRGRPKRRGRPRGGRRGRRPSANGSVQISLEHLLAAKKLADEVGGIDTAKEAIDALAKLS